VLIEAALQTIFRETRMELIKTKMKTFFGGRNGAIEYVLIASLLAILAVMALTRV
jgi:hypothetical protein